MGGKRSWRDAEVKGHSLLHQGSRVELEHVQSQIGLAWLSCVCSLGYLLSQLVYICGLLAVCSSIWGAGATDSLGQTCSLSKWQYREAQALVQRQLGEGSTQEPPLKAAAKLRNELGMVVPVCNPSMWQAEAGGLL